MMKKIKRTKNKNKNKNKEEEGGGGGGGGGASPKRSKYNILTGLDIPCMHVKLLPKKLSDLATAV